MSKTLKFEVTIIVVRDLYSSEIENLQKNIACALKYSDNIGEVAEMITVSVI